MKKIVILTEGGIKIGVGHISRCVALAQAFTEKGLKPTLLINGNKGIENLLQESKYVLLNWSLKKEELFNYIQNSDLVIVDSYLANISFYENLSKHVKFPVYLDDYQRINYPRGIVINGGIYADELNYPKQNDVFYLLGSKYCILRKFFWHSSNKKIKKDIRRLMITFGGEDIRNLTPKILKFLTEKFPEVNKDVIIGNCFPNISQIVKFLDDKTNLIYFPNQDRIKKIMQETDVAICAGGQTLYELAMIGVPTIAILTADNQIMNINGWIKAGFIEFAGCWNNEQLLNNIFNKMSVLGSNYERKNRSVIGRSIIDGKGVERILLWIEQKYHY